MELDTEQLFQPNHMSMTKPPCVHDQTVPVPRPTHMWITKRAWSHLAGVLICAESAY